MEGTFINVVFYVYLSCSVRFFSVSLSVVKRFFPELKKKNFVRVSLFSLEKVVNKKKDRLSTFRRSIVNIFSLLKHSISFLARFELKFVNSKTTIKIQMLQKKKEKKTCEIITSVSYTVYEISRENFESSYFKHIFSF